jgi:hypothetical protein
LQWAKHCGVLDAEKMASQNPFGVITNDPVEKRYKWGQWAAYMIQRRAVLGAFILDAQMAQLSGFPTVAKHISNPLQLLGGDVAFDATTAEAWIQQMEGNSSQNFTFRDYYALLLSNNDPVLIEHLGSSIFVVLEGLQSIVSDHNEAAQPAYGTPSKSEIHQALNQLLDTQIRRAGFVERMEMEIRWHTICLDLALNSALLCRQLCHECGIDQDTVGEGKIPNSHLDVSIWLGSIEGRQALLHAVAIREIVETLPMNRIHAMHIPAAVFSAATVFGAYYIFDRAAIKIPKVEDWHEVIEFSGESTLVPSSDVAAFLLGVPQSSTTMRNILYDIDSLQMVLRSVALRWGICIQMERILNSWVTYKPSSH